MKQLALKITLGYVRHLLTGFGGAMVTGGYMSNNQSVQIIGGIMAVIGAVWSHYSKVPLPDDASN